MRKLVVPALAGLAALSATALIPSKADAQVVIGVGVPGYVTPVQWGGYHGHHPHRPYYGYGRPYRPHYGYYRPYRPYVASCWVERRWVDTPWGLRPRPVRVCR